MNKIATALLLMLIVSATTELFPQTRIRFARGRTSTSVAGTIGSIGERDFVLGASSGQYLTANVSSRGGCIKFSTVSTSMAFRTDRGDNWLKLMNNCRRSVSFTMTISIQ